MDDFLKRQLSLIHLAVVDYRNGVLSLNDLVHRVEALGNVIGGKLWEDRLFEIVVDLERVNSEIIDKARNMTPNELEKIKSVLQPLEAIAAGY